MINVSGDNITFLHLILLSLATCRLSIMFVNEDGPMNVFKKIREWADIQEIVLPNGYTERFIIDEDENLIGGILSCTWCASVWFSAFLILLYLLSPLLAFLVAFWLSGSMLSILLNVTVDKLQESK